MNQRIIVMCVALFTIIVIGMFVFAYLKKQELTNEVPTPTPQPQEQVAYASLTRIDVKHFFESGLHTFVGEIPFPTPCELLETDALVAESYPEQITLHFDVVNTAEVCAQVVTAQRFKIEATASENASVRATFMGRAVELNIVPAGEGESPEDFELYIKG